MIWKRIRGFFGENEPEAATEEPEAVEEDAPVTPPETPQTPEGRLTALVEAEPLADAAAVLELVGVVAANGRAARALEALRAYLDRLPQEAPGRASVVLRAAELLSSRGDDAGADAMLAPWVARLDAPVGATMLAAEIAERAGDVARALALYEKVIAHDLDYPRARERIERLRELQSGAREGMVGVTLATEGALTRGRYRVERELGRGGAGTVFAAFDQHLDRRIALKVYHGRGPVERERLVVEAKVPASLEHPGVVRILDLDPSLGAIAMELCHGGSIRRELARSSVTLARATGWIRTSLEAVAFVHDAGYVHRDLKPSNFLLRADDTVVLTDFGLALERGQKQNARHGEGTLQYMPPEQRANAPAEPSMDVHAFGVFVRELVEAVGDAAPPAWSELSAACLRREPSARPRVGELRVAFAS
ncbi:MAG: serine/threonine protein kinase [Sandaracinus sp.]|nr:serine/threonine protein kinase [Sandaracinus sp.]MCB9632934.1 serine/threonine protein kinase [Sandaracinus sp.]